MGEEMTIGQEPSYVFSVTRDGVSYEISLRTFSWMTFATVVADGDVVAAGVRCVSGSWLIPYSHKMGDGGNFRFECSGESYPYYENFGIEAKLYYYTPEEYEKANGGT